MLLAESAGGGPKLSFTLAAGESKTVPVNDTLTAVVVNTSLKPGELTYKWHRDNAAISNAPESAYTLTAAGADSNTATSCDAGGLMAMRGREEEDTHLLGGFFGLDA